jgi:hypothetical protein
LGPGHMAKECKVKWLCDVNKCGKRHHRLLHPDTLNKTMYQMFFRQGLDDDLDSENESDKSKDQY